VRGRGWVAYGHTPCKFCGKRISTCGLGYVSHMRAHVRRGEAKEYVNLSTRLYDYERPAEMARRSP
jgi:hypothetical protein